MAEELTINLSAEYSDAEGLTGDVSIEDLLITLVTTKLLKFRQTIATSETALELGDISSRGFLVLMNLDPTNFVNVKVGTGGAIFAKMFPKGSAAGINFCVVHLGSGAQSPYLIADTASCDVESFLCPL